MRAAMSARRQSCFLRTHKGEAQQRYEARGNEIIAALFAF